MKMKPLIVKPTFKCQANWDSTYAGYGTRLAKAGLVYLDGAEQA